MFFFIQPWSGQSGSGFFPHSAAPPSSFAAAVFPESAAVPADAVAEGVALGSAEADADACALAVLGVAGALEATGGAVAVPSVGEGDSDFVHATSNVAIERTSNGERMASELTRNPG